ncbi:MAG TPA: MerR family transcriptional regulator [Prolixibacteraceae bacterium]|nr:MerR family transcriptional regulator [Prolixibacteraceae bacterium]
MGEVAAMFGVNASLIRFWEKKFPSIHPQKNKKGNRLFTRESIEEIRLIYHLVKERGMTLDGAKQKLKENKTDALQDHEIVRHLKHIRELLVEIKNELGNDEN